MLKIVIIEDEKRTALDLANTLKMVDSDIEITAMLRSVKEALGFFREDKEFDLIFSDIQLSDGLSFEIFRKIKITVPVIFCTAYEQYMLDAFNANGIDYLLKPFNKISVAKAVDKFMTLKLNFTSAENGLDRLMQKIDRRINLRTPTILIYQGEKIIPLDTQKIALFFLDADYVFAFAFESQKYIVTQSLEELETICGLSFFRVNRQYLVNRKAIKDVSRYLNRKILINLSVNYPEQILVSKVKAPLLLEWLTNT
ncbi:MAG: LytTR family DNA-binding domain-containing protein [Breznakibacter sp.]